MLLSIMASCAVELVIHGRETLMQWATHKGDSTTISEWKHFQYATQQSQKADIR